jgi:hypothetical protein
MNTKENPVPHWPRGLRRLLAAAYVGVSPNLWDTMVADGRMPKPKRVDNRTIWDKIAVDRAFDLLDGGLPRDESGEEVYEFAP